MQEINTSHIIKKKCEDCNWKGSIYVDCYSAYEMDGKLGRHIYSKGHGDYTCKECNGAGVVKYLIKLKGY